MIVAVDIRVLGTGRTSGVEEYTEHLLEHMLPMAPQFKFKLFHSGRTELIRRPWMDLPNVEVYELRRSNRLISLTTRLFGRPYLDDLVGGADIFFFPHFLAGATSGSCKRILTIHDLSFERFPEFFSLSRKFWHKFQVQPRVQAAKADKVIAVSESTRKDVVNIYGLSEDRVSVVRSGMISSMKRVKDEDISDFRKRKGLPERFILALGTLEPRKNLTSLIKAFEHLPKDLDDVALVIVGPKGWLFGDIYDLAKLSRASKKIRFMESIASDERRLWLSAASVLAYPSFFEGFGFPPLEAMACGTPVIVGANSSMLEVCGEAALPIDPYSIDSLRNALVALLKSPELCHYHVEKGLTRASEFSWVSTAERVLNEIVHVVNGDN